MPVVVLLPLLLLALLLPAGLALVLVGPARPFADEASSLAALVALAALLLTFLLSGRLRAVSGRVGIDRTLRWHQALAWALLAVLLVHPWLYTTPEGAAFARPDDVARAGSSGLDGRSMATGWIALLLLALLVLTGRFRDSLPQRYETWRAMHGPWAMIVAGLGVEHALWAGRYAQHPAVAASLLGLAGLALLSSIWVRLVRPLALARRPWRVAAVGRIAERTWEVVVEAAGHAGRKFRAGQFVWLKLDRGPFSLREHPFTIASAPQAPGRLGFVIKQAGDFTDRIGTVPVGSRAWIDGPHGTLLIDGRDEPGVAFLCGGVGIAPALSILRDALARGETRPMLLVYGNRRASEVVAGEELAALSRAMPLRVVHVLAEPPPAWDGESGLLDAALVGRLCREPAALGWLFVLCGPTPMLKQAVPALQALGVPDRRILAERFSYD
jgi:predicted ferric reductase